jgi:calpain-7
MTPELERYHGLIGNHNYAVLDLQQRDGEPALLIKNPWRQSSELRDSYNEVNGSFGCSGLQGHSAKADLRTFWMPLSKAFRVFRVLYLNWNPALFQLRSDVHFAWDLTKPRSRTLATSPQFSISSEKGGLAWFLIGRHLQDPAPSTNAVDNSKSLDLSSLKSALTIQERAPLTGYLSMYVLDRGGVRSFLTGGYLSNSPFLDGLQIFLPFELEPRKRYTLALRENLLPSVSQQFTLSVFSSSKLEVGPAENKYRAATITLQDEWTPGMYGLSSTSSAFNPQFLITVPSPTPIAVFLDCEDEFAKVNMKLCKRGGRISDVKRIDILAESHISDFELGGAWFETGGHEIGSDSGERSYTLMILNMDEDYRGKFALRVEANVTVKVTRIPNGYAGHVLRMPKAVFSGSTKRLAAPILPSAEGDVVKVVVRFDSSFIPGVSSATDAYGDAGSQSLVKITFEKGQGVAATVVASTSTIADEFSPIGKDGLRLDGVKVWRAMTHDPWRLFLVIERSGGCTLPGSEERFTVDVVTERLGSVLAEEWREWDDD